MSEKQKTMQQPSRQISNVKMILLFVFATIGAVIVLILIPIISLGDGVIQQTSLPDELLPTAEYIYSTVPLDESVSLTNYVSIKIDTAGFGTGVICFDAGFVPVGFNYPGHSQIFVNGVRVRGASNRILLDGFSGAERMNLCIEGDLEPGLHLLEFHLRESDFGEPIATQQWAIEIE